jgi:hypothetical protein
VHFLIYTCIIQDALLKFRVAWMHPALINL